MSSGPPDSYVVIARGADVETEVRRSRFLARLRRVADEDQARAVIDEARREHRAARHHCSAYVIGPDGRLTRSSDDGEPSGTAGAPMLEVLAGRGVSDVVAVVTRYFGGVKLGTGGLARAYGDAVRAGLDAAGKLVRQRMVRVDVLVEAADAGRLENALRSRAAGAGRRGPSGRDGTPGMRVLGVDYAEPGDLATIRAAVPPAHLAAFEAEAAARTGGGAVVTATQEGWYDRPDPTHP